MVMTSSVRTLSPVVSQSIATNLVCGARLEHEPVRLIADRGLMEKAFDRAGDHVRNMPSLKWWRMSSRNCFHHLESVAQQIAFHARQR